MMTMCLETDVLEPLRQMCLQSNEPVKPLQNVFLSAKWIDAKVGELESMRFIHFNVCVVLHSIHFIL